MKNRKIQVHLFGALGERTTEVSTRGGFPTRKPIKVSSRETAPSLPSETQTETQSPVNPKSDAFPAPTLFEVLKWMEASEDHSGWLIIDEILFVATTLFKMTFNHNTLLDALRLLYQKGVLEYRRNSFDQHTFRLIEKQTAAPSLKDLLAEVDTIMGGGDIYER